MYERMLAALDVSNAAEIVFPYVEEIGAKFRSEITLVSVTEAQTDMELLYKSYLEQIKEEVQRQVEDYGGEQVKVFWKVLVGKPADEILRYADEINANLIVIASRGSSGRGHWPLGSIAAKVLRAATMPMLLVRAPATDCAIQEKRLIKKILVPLDGSELGAAAIPYAKALGQAADAELVLFQVVEPQPLEGLSPDRKAYEKVLKADAVAYLDSVAKDVRREGLNISTAVDFGFPEECIIDYARMNSVDLIAISSRGRRGIVRWAFGSVVDRVLHDGDTPVLVIRAART
jgi:nucleotide-binding universal stress UspA family protein